MTVAITITVAIFTLQAMKYLSIGEEDDISWSLIKAAFSSVAQTAIIPMQDILGLGSSARMNTPATEVSQLPFFNLMKAVMKVYNNNVSLVFVHERWGTGDGGFQVQLALVIFKLNLTDSEVYYHCTVGFSKSIQHGKE